jgi:hypothetical protein
VEDRAVLKARRNLLKKSGPFVKPQTPYHKTFILSNLISIKADDITDIMVCQTLKPYKKISQNQEKLSIIVMFYLKTI